MLCLALVILLGSAVPTTSGVPVSKPRCAAPNPCGPGWWSGNKTACCTGDRAADPPCCFEGHHFVPNNLARTPPLGWRSWNAFLKDVDQVQMEDVMRGLAKKRVDGVSLADVGYTDVGLDAGYVLPGKGYGGGCHTRSGHLIINQTGFPSLKGMTDTAHGLNLTASWYLNLDGGCPGVNETAVGPTYHTDAADAVKYGFDGVKLDTESGGPSHNITLWAMALTEAAAAAGKTEGMVIENCQDKNPTYLLDDPTDCPYNFYRTGPDNSPSFFGGLHHVYNYAVPYLRVMHPVPASRPHCWAYPDMLGIGSPVAGTPHWQIARQRGCANMTLDEERALFANWAIISSPLVLSFDVRDDAVVAKYWPIVANPRVIQINRAWAGSAGTLLKESARGTNRSVPVGADCVFYNRFATIPDWLLYAKPLPGGGVAVLAINAGEQVLTAADGAIVTVADLIATVVTSSKGTWPTPTSPTAFAAADAWTGAPLPSVTTSMPWSAAGLSPHNSTFVLFTPIPATS